MLPGTEDLFSPPWAGLLAGLMLQSQECPRLEKKTDDCGTTTFSSSIILTERFPFKKGLLPSIMDKKKGKQGLPVLLPQRTCVDMMRWDVCANFF